MKRKGEGGMLPENVVSVAVFVVAVLVIAVPAYAVINVYFGHQDEKNAQNLLDSLEGKINLLEEGQNNTFLIQGVDGWVLVGYNKEDPNRPDKCFFESCFCACPVGDEGRPYTQEFLSNSCQEGGFCRDVETRVDIFTNRTHLSNYAAPESSQINRCILMFPKIIPFYVEKRENYLQISVETDASKETGTAYCFS